MRNLAAESYKDDSQAEVQRLGTGNTGVWSVSGRPKSLVSWWEEGYMVQLLGRMSLKTPLGTGDRPSGGHTCARVWQELPQHFLASWCGELREESTGR